MIRGRRAPRTAFKRGQKRPPGAGRQKGTPNKVTVEVRQATRELVDDPAYRRSLTRRLKSGKLATAMESLLWYYAYGKPKDEVDLDVKMRPSQMTDEQLRERALALAERLKGR